MDPTNLNNRLHSPRSQMYVAIRRWVESQKEEDKALFSKWSFALASSLGHINQTFCKNRI